MKEDYVDTDDDSNNLNMKALKHTTDAKIIKIRYQGGRVMNSLSQRATNNVQSITPLEKELQSWAEESVVVTTEKMTIGETHNIWNNV